MSKNLLYISAVEPQSGSTIQAQAEKGRS